ncbi:MAG TPA: DUF374 domain-containing protein [Thermoanaerobaculales bacterium]|nr:DUF374 domain-containing protein [Thermoanaerobaculales bacterium]
MAERSQRRRRSLLGTVAVALAPVIVAAVRLLWASYRFRISGEDAVRRAIERGEPLILTSWHEGVFVMAWYSLRLARMGARVTYLVSPSRDGDLVTRMLEVIGGRVVRGSATRSGVRALHGLYRAITGERASPLLLCDGPHGPRYYCKAGPVLLGQLSGAHILPIGAWPRRAIHLRTWDRAYVPLPLTRVEIVLGEPIAVAPGLSAEQQEMERVALEGRLADLAARARRAAAGNGEIPPAA